MKNTCIARPAPADMVPWGICEGKCPNTTNGRKKFVSPYALGEPDIADAHVPRGLHLPRDGLCAGDRDELAVPSDPRACKRVEEDPQLVTRRRTDNTADQDRKTGTIAESTATQQVEHSFPL